jgi:hypothetical protein
MSLSKDDFQASKSPTLMRVMMNGMGHLPVRDPALLVTLDRY